MSPETRKPGLSLKEKNRRYSLLREKMKEAGYSALIVLGGIMQAVATVHYLTKVWGSRGNAVIFPIEGEPILLIPSNTGITAQSLVENGCWVPVENIHQSANLAEDLARWTIGHKLQKSQIGIDSFRFWTVYDFQLFTDKCPDVRLVEAHRFFGQIRGPKSSEELALIEEAIRISDLAHYTFLANLKPGITEEEVARKAVDVIMTHDALANNPNPAILIHSRPEIVYPYAPGRTVIQKPNPVTFGPEFTRKLGGGAQMFRCYCWEKPKGDYKKIFELYHEIRQIVVQELRPGLEIIEAGKKIKNLVEKWGFECDKIGHGIGISHYCNPYITAGSRERDYIEWTIQAGEVYEVHPMIRNKDGKPPLVMNGDMFFIGKSKTTWMTTALPGLPEMIPQ